MNKKRSPIPTLPHQNAKKKGSIDPALRAVLLFFLPSVIIRIVCGLLGYAWIGGIIQMILYLWCGYSAASAYYQTIRQLYPNGRPKESLRKGAAAGLTLGILLAIVQAILLLVFGSNVVSLPFVIGEVVIICWIPFDILAGLLLGALGGKISANVWR